MVTQVNEKAIKFSETNSVKKAQMIGQKVAYNFEYVRSSKNISKKLSFNPKISQEYNITVSNGTTEVSYNSGDISFPTRYEGPTYNLKTTENYILTYDGGVVVK